MSLVQMSFSGAVLILAVIIIRAVAVNRLPKKTFLILWDIALVRLLLPVSIPSMCSVYTLARHYLPEHAFIWDIAGGGGFAVSGEPAAGTVEMYPTAGTVEMYPTAGMGEYPTAGMGEYPTAGTGEQHPTAGAWETHPTAGAWEQHPSAGTWNVQLVPQGIARMFLPDAYAASGIQVCGWFLVWFAGMAFCAVFFMICYVRCRREFRASLPVQDAFVTGWLSQHPLRRKILVRQLDRISAPLTYGIFRPVILLPKNTDFADTGQLSYMLLHEYMHILRLDALAKLACTAVLCIHWFNPFVWVMYFLYHRDIELACDESVVHRLGETSKAGYARVLIFMEAKKSGFVPFGNHFSKNVVEERITAIMKTKKTSRAAVLAATVLIASVTTAFATSAAGNGEHPATGDTAGIAGDRAKTAVAPNASNGQAETMAVPEGFTEEEYGKLLALQFPGYEDMTVKAYMDKVWEMTDAEGYLALLERFFEDGTLQRQQNSHAAASFLHHILGPLMRGNERNWSFDGFAQVNHPRAADSALLEYSFKLTVLDGERLTVREYNEARLALMHGMEGILRSRTVGELQEDVLINAEAQRKIRKFAKEQSTDSLQVTVDACSYRPLRLEPVWEDAPAWENEEVRDYPNATQEDYASLLALKTPDYRKMPVADFNDALLDWGNEDFERAERIEEDCKWEDCAVTLSDEEKSFLKLTVRMSGIENYEYVKSLNTGKPKKDPVASMVLADKEKEALGNGYGWAWCTLECSFSYHISDEKKVTVGERDQCVGGFDDSVKKFWENTDVEKLLAMGEKKIVKKLEDMAAKYSTSRMTLKIVKSHTGFQGMDDRIYE